ncbi:MAG: hypothetical protein IJ274_12195, partial [Lachnospiraceae bacterium]|nr:hypothetical protein [Lachnospiraceae bacterium]
IGGWCRFLQIVSLMWATFVSVGLLQKGFWERAIPLDTLSTFFSGSMFSRIMLVLSLAMLFFYSYGGNIPPLKSRQRNRIIMKK